MKHLKRISRLIVIPAAGLILGLLFLTLSTGRAEAHPNGVNWAATCAATTQQTGWAAYDQSFSSYTVHTGDTVHATVVLDAHGCHTQNAYNSSFVVSGQNISGLSLNAFGVQPIGIGTVFAGSSNTHTVNVSFVVGAGDQGDTNHCFQWYGGGDYYAGNNTSGAADHRNSGVGKWCFTVKNLGNPPPPKGNLVATKYGAWKWNTMCIRQDGQSNTIACNWYSNVAAFNTATNVKYNVQAEPINGAQLVGFRLNYYDANGLHSCHVGEFPGAVDSGLNGLYGLLCYYANPAGGIFSNIAVAPNNTTYLDLYYKDSPPVGVFEKLSCNAADPTNKKLHASGWAYDLSNTNRAIGVAFWDGNAAGPTTNLNFSAVANGRGRGNEVGPGNVSLNGHLFDTDLPAAVNDGKLHYIYAYALGINPDGSQNGDNTFIGVKAINAGDCKSEVAYYPWLQTQKGDITSLSTITGQNIGVGDVNNQPFGARHATDNSHKYQPTSGSLGASSQPNPEASYVVAAGSGKNFCSASLYTLGTKQDPDAKICNLSAYLSNFVQYDTISKTVTNAWNNNGAGSGGTCAPYKTATVATYINANINLGCTGSAGIQRTNGNFTLVAPSPPFVPITGRGTLWVTGNLTIKNDIMYANSGFATPLQNLPNFVIIVDGDVNIDAGVTRIDAAIVAKGTINSCLQHDTTCRQPLITNGLWAAFGNNPISFGRRSFNQAAANSSPADSIVLTGQTIILPPPGLDQRDSDIGEQLQINAGELPPRLH
jgi:hypothetical protein